MKRRRESVEKTCGKCDDARRGSLSFGPSSNVVQQRRKSLDFGGIVQGEEGEVQGGDMECKAEEDGEDEERNSKV
jgi:hypothetical protein